GEIVARLGSACRRLDEKGDRELMAFCWYPNSVPGLRDLTPEVRREVVDRAIRTFPVSFWSGFLVVSLMLGGAAGSVVVGILFGDTAGLLAVLPLCLFVWPLLINLARPRMREILQQEVAAPGRP